MDGQTNNNCSFLVYLEKSDALILWQNRKSVHVIIIYSKKHGICGVYYASMNSSHDLIINL